MPWRTTCPMDQRVQFMAEWLKDEESRAVLCRRYGISRKTGYQLAARYASEAEGAFRARSRAPHQQALALAEPVETALLELRARHPRWGPRKLRAWLMAHQPTERWPAPSTIGALLHRHGVAIPRRRRTRIPPAPPLAPEVEQPNDRWSADFKGWFVTGDGVRCQPFTLADYCSRFLLRCQIVAAGDAARVRPLFDAVFQEYGLPGAILTDNGPPFVTTGVGGLSRLAIWWLKLDIRPERIAPGQPQQNGRHERLHRTLKAEATTPPARTLADQQRGFDRFRCVYNEERPHGVHVGLVLPGFVSTEGFPQRELMAKPYTRWVVSSVEKVADAIVEAGPGGKAERYVPRPYYLAAVARILAPRLVRKVTAGGATTPATAGDDQAAAGGKSTISSQ